MRFANRDFDRAVAERSALIRFSYIVRKASGFLSRGATVSTHGRRGRQTHVRTVRIFSPDFLLCLCFKPIPFVWLIYGAARAVPSVRDRDHGESIRCRSCEMIRWNLYSLERIFPSLSLLWRPMGPLLHPSVNEIVGGKARWWYLREIGEFIFRM